MSIFGGGGVKCVVCDKTSYPAETITFEKKPYHFECFRCSNADCNKKMENCSKAAMYDDKLFCKQCFNKAGYAQKQSKVVWTKKETTGSAGPSKFGGGGSPCAICQKTVYVAETLLFEKKVYHPACFMCSKEDCKKVMSASGAAEFDGKLYCKKCFANDGLARKQADVKRNTSAATINPLASKFGGGGTKCPRCEKTVYPAEALSFEKVTYHSECFTCTDCGKKMTPAGAAQFEGGQYCLKCFQNGGFAQKQAATAKVGGSGTTNPMASRFGGGGNPCSVCGKTVYAAETLSFEKQLFHPECFKCRNCDKKMSVGGAEGKKMPDGSVQCYCKKCWNELGLHQAKTN